MNKINYSTILFSLLLLSLNLQAQIVINEYSCANVSHNADSFSKYEDWIEIYNSGAGPVNISGYYLSDRLNQPTKWMIPAGTIINGNDRLIFFASGKNLAGGEMHTNFRLTQTKFPSETIVLSDNTGNVIDYITISRTKRIIQMQGFLMVQIHGRYALPLLQILQIPEQILL
jgi:hypothetical protein